MDAAARRAFKDALAQGQVGELVGNMPAQQIQALVVGLLTLHAEAVRDQDRDNTLFHRFTSLHDKDSPYLVLQWKGGPCVDWRCACGLRHHGCDTEFMYQVHCTGCARSYEVGREVQLIQLSQARARETRRAGYGRVYEASEHGQETTRDQDRDLLRFLQGQIQAMGARSAEIVHRLGEGTGYEANAAQAGQVVTEALEVVETVTEAVAHWGETSILEGEMTMVPVTVEPSSCQVGMCESPAREGSAFCSPECSNAWDGAGTAEEQLPGS